MTGSGWIVLLPLVGAILGGIVGAVGGAWANSWYRDREAKKLLKEEREGLLIVISAEVRYNLRLLDLIHEGKPSATIQNLRTDIWDNTQVRFAQLFPASYTEEMANFYSVVAVNQISPIAHKTSTESLTEEERRAIQFMVTLGTSIMRHAEDYVEDPWFADSVDDLERRIRKPQLRGALPQQHQDQDGAVGWNPSATRYVAIGFAVVAVIATIIRLILPGKGFALLRNFLNRRNS